MKKLKVGVIGVGHMGLYHANILSSLNDYVQLIGVSDMSEERAGEVGEKYGVPYYTDNDELLSQSDAVCIAVPTYQHHKETMRAFNHNVNVLVEKPITNNIDDAVELVNTAKKKGLVFQVGHLERFRGTVRGLKKIIDKPYLIEAKRFQPRNNRINDVGVVLDLMIHDIDIIHMLIDSEVVNVSAYGRSVYTDFEDIAKVSLLFENDCIVDLTTSRLAQDKTRKLDVYQKNADIHIDFFKDEISIHRKSSTQYEVAKNELKYYEKMYIENVYVQTENPLKDEIMHFINNIKGKEKPLVNGNWDIKILRTTFNIINLLDKNSFNNAV